jgi:8-oxo-dGTP pyrophosphatase MutT (NUDIX family)
MAFKLLDGMSRRRDLVTLGAQGLVIGEGGRVLLIRHGYRPGWHFPGGGVEVGETVEMALARELHEETGVILTGPAEFRGLYANFQIFPGDHVALFVVRAWEQPAIPPANAEIAEQGFFHWQSVPESTVQGPRRRLAEVFGGTAQLASW